MPDFSSSRHGGPIEYRNCFSKLGGSPLIIEDEITSFGDLVEFVRKQPELLNRFVVEIDNDEDDDFALEMDSIIIKSGIKNSIERYIYKFNSFEYVEEQGYEAVEPTIAYIFDKSLNIDIYIPILFLSFPFDEFEVSNDVYIQRISDKHHIARYKIVSHNVSTNEYVTSSATHALTLKGWQVPNNDRMWHFNTLSTPRAYPLDLIDKFFGALRISSSVDTGYAQIFSSAIGWEAHCKAGLPYLQGATVRAYPGWFENYYWNVEKIPGVSMDTMDTIRTIYNHLVSATENSIDLSVKRLNRCVIRDNEEDAILDATIALEALLSDDGNQEMTHKLALRVGALSTLDRCFGKSAQQAFRDIKNIYSYRSAIVHGSKSLEKKRIIKIDESNNVAAHTLAVDYLRMLLRVLLINPRYRDPIEIDNSLLLNCERKPGGSLDVVQNDVS